MCAFSRTILKTLCARICRRENADQPKKYNYIFNPRQIGLKIKTIKYVSGERGHRKKIKFHWKRGFRNNTYGRAFRPLLYYSSGFFLIFSTGASRGWLYIFFSVLLSRERDLFHLIMSARFNPIAGVRDSF